MSIRAQSKAVGAFTISLGRLGRIQFLKFQLIFKNFFPIFIYLNFQLKEITRQGLDNY